MRTFKAIVEYDGTDFAGFQWQHGVRTVQVTLEEAIASRTGSRSRLTGAGRTDAGVHALGQVISFQCESGIPTDRMALALNSALPPDVSIREAMEVDSGFSARFSASSRLYAYLILNRDVRSALIGRYCGFYPQVLDISAMRHAAERLVGELDFAAFTNELEQDQVTLRNVMRCHVGRYRQFVVVRIEANAFLRGMVRTAVGTLLKVGMGKLHPGDIDAILQSRNRQLAGPSAPAQGLCLLKVRYGQRKNYTRET